MSSCTIYIRHPDPAACVEELRARSESRRLAIHLLVREKPGDQFSRLILGTHNLLRQKKEGKEEDHRAALDFVATTSVIVGIPGSEDRSVADSLRLAASICEGFDARCFDGHSLRDQAGADIAP